MIWPFKKKAPPPPREPAPCGDDAKHCYWTERAGFCVLCASIRWEKQKRAEEDRMVNKIADAVVRRLEWRDETFDGEGLSHDRRRN